MFDYNRRRSSAGLFFAALGAASLASAPLAAAAPAADASVSGWAEKFSFTRRGSQPDLYERTGERYINKNNTAPQKRSGLSRRSEERILRARQGACLDGSYTEDDINALLSDGGRNTKVVLCPNAKIMLQGPIDFTAVGQEISTQGYPTGSSRAALIVDNPNMDVAIWNSCDQCSGTQLRNIEIDGSRPTLGWMGNGAGLIEMGGNAKYQVVDNCNIHDPRGWSALHVIEGWRDSCTSQVITNNQVGPAGTAPNTARQFHVEMQQFKEFMTTPPRELIARDVSAPGRWADGLSVACRNTTITGNTITGATDGGIVLFGSPGSTITGNTIISKDNTLLGGINMVDHGPFNGDYSGSLIAGNTLITDNAMTKIGIAIGTMVWGNYNSTSFRTNGGTVKNNVFKSKGNGGYFGYGVAVAGHEDADVSGNNYSGGLFGGARSAPCIPGMTPDFQAAIADPYTMTGKVQGGMTNMADIAFLICTMPCEYDGSCGTNSYPKGPIAAVGNLPSAANTTTVESTTSTSSTASSSTLSSTSTSTSSSSSSSSSSSTSSSASKTSSTSKTSTSSSPSSSSTSKTSSSTSSSSTSKTSSTSTSKTTASRSLAPQLVRPQRTNTKPALIRGGAAQPTAQAKIVETVLHVKRAMPRKRSAQEAADALESQLAVYRDWIVPGAVRTPRAKRSILQDGYDKRNVLADADYWGAQANM